MKSTYKTLLFGIILVISIVTSSALFTYLYLILEREGFWQLQQNVAYGLLLFGGIICGALIYLWKLIKSKKEIINPNDYFSILMTTVLLTTSIKVIKLILF
jgi:hypothetical protein